ncbi:MAG: endonuclease [Bacteroidota bacterium]|nr:endonuclease [Bacteroidota bacterium]
MKHSILNIWLRIFGAFLFLLLLRDVYSQSGNPLVKTEVSIMFYNVENLFDLEDDELTRDEEYLPSGIKNWNEHKLVKKLRSVYKVIVAAGKWEPPALIALAEIENLEVLRELLNQTPLKDMDYGCVHFDSPDERGIDLALLYRKNIFQIIHEQAIGINFPFDPANKTRDILYVAGMLENDTVHIFVNHWPSRYGGAMATEPHRLHVSQVLCRHIDSLTTIDPDAKIIICGDFNDEFRNESLQTLLTCNANKISPLKPGVTKKVPGTLKFQQKWYIFDMFMVSEALLDTSSALFAEPWYRIVAEDFMLLEDSKGYGYQPYRTYNGPHYIGGFSDHLPVQLILRRTKEYDRYKGE